MNSEEGASAHGEPRGESAQKEPQETRDFAQGGSVPASQEGSVPASRKRDPWAHRRGEPRTFAAAWILFLFGATIVSVGAVGAFGILSADVYRPAARVMVEIMAVGIAVLWPMVRLSQEPASRPLKAMVLDIIVIVGPVQAVVWPQALSWMAAWPLEVVLLLDAFLVGWTVLIGGLLAVYFTRPRLARWGMMALILLLVLVGPLIAALMSPSPGRVLDPSLSPAPVEWFMTSPLTGVYEITRDRSWTGQFARVDMRHLVGVMLAWGAGMLVWLAALSLHMKSPGESGGVARGRGVA